MPRTIRCLLVILPLALFAGCGTVSPLPGGKVSVNRDTWGHRPGARGFSTVILDAGHGGKDQGATSRALGLKEKDLALEMVKRVRSELSGSVRTVLTRSSDVFVELEDRVAMVNRRSDAILVSIHFNSGRSRIAGPEVYYWRVDSYSLGKRIQAALSRVAPDENGNRGLVRRRLRLTRNPELACVLVECGYLSNRSEAQRIAGSYYRARLAKAIAGAILDSACRGRRRRRHAAQANLRPAEQIHRPPPIAAEE